MSHMRHLKRLGEQFTISIQPDEDGFVGRECPAQNCQGYFKLQPGTGLKGENLPCHCPYCGHVAKPTEFATQEQIEFAKSVVIKQVTDAIRRDVQDWDRELRRSTRNSFIEMSVDYKGTSHPIRYYREKRLETTVVCEKCTLRYAIYGVFAFCPDCGEHNSLKILDKNLELAEKEIALADQVDKDLAEHLIGDALENAVSAFDGFGRETCKVHASASTTPGRVENISFQNLGGVRQRIQDLFGFDLSSGVDAQEWNFACQCFQKRHLLAHKMGVIDQAYIDATHDPQAVIGRKISIDKNEAASLIRVLRKLGAYLANSLSSAPSPTTP